MAQFVAQRCAHEMKELPLSATPKAGIAVPRGVADVLEQLRGLTTADRAARVERAVRNLFTDALMRLPDGTVFVLTGDIPAMWLRDSTWQLRPLLAAAHEAQTYEVLAGVSRRQAAYVLLDPYANAFNPSPNGNCWHRDFESQSPWVFERKYELDSLAAFLDLALRLHRASNRCDHLDEQFVAAATLALEIIEREQQHDPASYQFVRLGAAAHDQLSHDGFGAPVGRTGMSWSGFRPSDDACTYGYLIPANAHAAVVLEQLADLPALVHLAEPIRAKARAIAGDIRAGISAHAVTVKDERRIYAYEVDGLGQQVHMDDANVPSLLSLPYLGWCEPDDALYAATRDWVLSDANPWFSRGAAGFGIGSPHTPPSHIWPIAIAMVGLTSTDPHEVADCLDLLEATDGGTGRMHESFHCDSPDVFTRAWFSWADMTYVHLVLRSVGLAFD